MEIENILAVLVQKAASEPYNWSFRLQPDPDLGLIPMLEATFLPLGMAFIIFDDGVEIEEFEFPAPASKIVANHIMQIMLHQTKQLNDCYVEKAETNDKVVNIANVVPIKPDKPN